MMQQRWLKLMITAGLVFCGLSNVVYAENSFEVNGGLMVVDQKTEGKLGDYLTVSAHKVGNESLWIGNIDRVERGFNYKVEVKDLQKNDQLIVTAETNNLNDGVNGDWFGGAVTVVTEKEMQTGYLSGLSVELAPLPTPEMDSFSDNQIKVCWKGLDDFSVVGYQVYRSSNKDTGWENIGRSGQSAGKQVCYLDSKAVDGALNYYKISVLTSWSGGQNKEVYVSKAMSSASNGIRIGKGVVDDWRSQYKTVSALSQNDKTVVVEKDLSKVAVMGAVGGWMDRIKSEIKARNMSYQFVILGALIGLLLIVMIWFVISIAWHNKTSKGSGVWR